MQQQQLNTAGDASFTLTTLFLPYLAYWLWLHYYVTVQTKASLAEHTTQNSFLLK